MRALLVLAIAVVPIYDAVACQSVGHGCDPPSLETASRAATRVVAGTVASIDKHQHCVIDVAARWKGDKTTTVEHAECWRWKVGAKVISLEFPADRTWKVAPADVVADTATNRATLDKLFGRSTAP